MEPTNRKTWALLAGVIGLGAVLRLWLCFHDDGMFWPDEVFQSLEPAHKLVFGYGLVAWEFIEGARNWALPAVVAVMMELARALGQQSPSGYLHVVRVLFACIGAGTAVGAYALARTLGARAVPAVVGASLFALCAPFLYFAPKAMSETASALPVVVGFALALRPDVGRQTLVVGASLLGLSVLLRLQNGIFCVGLLGIFAGRKDWRRTGEAAATLVAWALAFGMLDKLTWGDWFHSAIVYLRFNFLEGKAAQWGTAAASFYLRVLWTSLGLAGLALLGLSGAAYPRARGLVITAAAFWVLHSATAHKEYRFLLPVMPVMAALVGVGLTVLRERAAKSTADLALLGTALVALLSAARFPALTFGELGQYEDSKPNASAYDDSGFVNRLLLAAYGQPDLCGLKVEAVHLAWTGGYSYLHRKVPLYPHTGAARESGYFNYVITPERAAAPEQVVAREGPLVLARMGPGCREDFGYSWRLP